MLRLRISLELCTLAFCAPTGLAITSGFVRLASAQQAPGRRAGWEFTDPRGEAIATAGERRGAARRGRSAQRAIEVIPLLGELAA